MPFSHLHYRWLKNQNYDYSKKRCCYLAVCLTYTVIFAILGAIFLGLYYDKVNYLNSLNCSSACGWLGATFDCGFQLCCTSFGFPYTYEYCTNTYGVATYYLLCIIFFCYAIYEFLLMVCTFCRGSAFQNANVIIIDQNPQYIGLTTYPNQQQIYQGNNQMQNQQQKYQGNNQTQTYNK